MKKRILLVLATLPFTTSAFAAGEGYKVEYLHVPSFKQGVTAKNPSVGGFVQGLAQGIQFINAMRDTGRDVTFCPPADAPMLTLQDYC